jgi:RNA polymerase sigma-70 factor (ECF subfamily)
MNERLHSPTQPAEEHREHQGYQRSDNQYLDGQTDRIDTTQQEIAHDARQDRQPLSPERQREFEEVAIPLMSSVYHFAYNLVGNADDAQDLLQETYLKAYRFFDSFQQGTNCKAWLFQIAKNSFINRYRKQTREPDKVRYDAIEEFYDTLRPSNVEANNLDVTFFHDLLDDDISAALQSLPEPFRQVLILSDIESMTYEEIAELVGCPIGTVRSRLHRARKVLRDKLADYARARGFTTAESDSLDE